MSAEAEASTEHLIRVAEVVLGNVGAEMSHSRLVRSVRKFQRVGGRGLDFVYYLANVLGLDREQRARLMTDPDVARVIAYADPTGETAVRNVMRAQR
jgi:hypothetical protein